VPKRAKELTAKTGAALKDEGRHAVGGAVGLHLRIEGSTRWWVLRIKIRDRRRDLGFGCYPDVSLSHARDLARDKRKEVSGNATRPAQLAYAAPHPLAVAPGFAPPAAPQPLPPAPLQTAPPVEGAQSSDKEDEAPPTFESCAKKHIAAREPGWKSRKHGKQWLSTLETYAFPVIPDADLVDEDRDGDTSARSDGEHSRLDRSSGLPQRKESRSLGRQSRARASLAHEVEVETPSRASLHEDGHLHG